MNAKIRKAEVGDISALRVLLEHLAGKELGYEVVEDRLRLVEASGIDELYVLEDEHGIQGLLGFRLRENIEERIRYGEVSALVTHPQARRSGYGRALMAFAEQLARKRGCKGTWLVSGFSGRRTLTSSTRNSATKSRAIVPSSQSTNRPKRRWSRRPWPARAGRRVAAQRCYFDAARRGSSPNRYAFEGRFGDLILEPSRATRSRSVARRTTEAGTPHWR